VCLRNHASLKWPFAVAELVFGFGDDSGDPAGPQSGPDRAGGLGLVAP